MIQLLCSVMGRSYKSTNTHSSDIGIQSLEFVAETRILTDIKIEHRGKIYFPWGKKSTSIFFLYEIKMDL